MGLLTPRKSSNSALLLHAQQCTSRATLGCLHPCLWPLKAPRSTFWGRVAKPLISSLTPVHPSLVEQMWTWASMRRRWSVHHGYLSIEEMVKISGMNCLVKVFVGHRHKAMCIRDPESVNRTPPPALVVHQRKFSIYCFITAYAPRPCRLRI